MRMVSEDEYQQLTKQPKTAESIKNHFFHKRGEQASELLNSKKIPEDIKMHLYSSLMKNVKKQLKEIIIKPIYVKLTIENTHINGKPIQDALDTDNSSIFFLQSQPLFLNNLYHRLRQNFQKMMKNFLIQYPIILKEKFKIL